MARPPIGITHLILLQYAAEGLLEIDFLLVGQRNQHEKNVGQLEGQILLGLTRFFRLVAVAMVQLTRQLTDFLDQARQVLQRRPVALLELADVRIHGALGISDRHFTSSNRRMTRSSSSSVL